MFFPELNDPARPAAARPVSLGPGWAGGGHSAVRTRRRDDSAEEENPFPVGKSATNLPGLATAGSS